MGGWGARFATARREFRERAAVGKGKGGRAIPQLAPDKEWVCAQAGRRGMRTAEGGGGGRVEMPFWDGAAWVG